MDTGCLQALSDYEANLIRVKAHQLVGKYGFTGSDSADLEQDLALHLIQRMTGFDPNRGSRNTYADRIVSSRIASILRQRFAQCRDFRRSVSLDGHSTDECSDCEDVVDPHHETGCSQADLAIDVEDAVRRLEADLQSLCVLLMQEPVSEAARRLGLTRGQVRGRLQTLRNVFASAGLDAYLTDGPANSKSNGVSKE
ncbi:MAG: sigma-70 family RNA polymerase sigma factor [Phycisphaerae bacterium]|nr:sigma-70 family RNA polymerase sigma factor [Phycisphaerae bacterium]